MKITQVLTAASLLAPASAFWRMECRGRLGLARIDPMVSPGEVAQHVHAIHGSSGFSESATYEDVTSADCTSCAVTQDKSVYWTPAMYFKHANGSYELVPQTGGMLAYYFLNSPPGQAGNITSFPNGFRMIAGDSLRRNYSIGGLDFKLPDPEKSLWALLGQTSQVDLTQRAIGFNCLNYDKAPEGSLYRHYLPSKDYLDQFCSNGVRIELMFPSCWNGKDLDSANHRDHVAYPDLVMEGNCPPGFPIRLPGLFYETIWETDVFRQVPGEFVLSNGDTNGFGYHGDFLMGWDEAFLQQAVDTCTNPSGSMYDCPIFNIQNEAVQNQCSMKIPSVLASEKVAGVVGTVIPGNVAIQYGPQPATMTNPPSQTAPVPVPTVSYSPGSENGEKPSNLPGQVFITQASPTPPPAATSSAPEISAHPAINQVNQVAPKPTEAPSSTVDDGLPIVSTQYITDGDVVSEIIWKESVLYVTEYEDTTTTVTVTRSAVVNKVRNVGHVHRRAGHNGRRAHHH